MILLIQSVVQFIICIAILSMQLYVYLHSMAEIGKQYHLGLVPPSTVFINLLYHSVITVLVVRGLFFVN